MRILNKCSYLDGYWSILFNCLNILLIYNCYWIRNKNIIVFLKKNFYFWVKHIIHESYFSKHCYQSLGVISLVDTATHDLVINNFSRLWVSDKSDIWDEEMNICRFNSFETTNFSEFEWENNKWRNLRFIWKGKIICPKINDPKRIMQWRHRILKNLMHSGLKNNSIEFFKKSVRLNKGKDDQHKEKSISEERRNNW